jgi:site-specific recombinase XerD
MPDDVQEDIHKYARERGIADGNPWVDAGTSTVRRWVKQAAEEIAAQTGNERWLEVSSHDLRRSWATYHLVEQRVDVRTMMSVGGWSDYSAIEPYLTKPTESRIGEAFEEAEVV